MQTRVGCKRRLQIARHIEFEACSAVVDLICKVSRANHCAIEPPLFKAVVMIALSGNPLSTPTACCVIVLLMCTYLSIKCTLLAHKVGFIVRFLFYFIYF